MERSPPRAIVFDKDGTLFDLQATWGRFTEGLLRECAAGDDAVDHSLAAALGFDPDNGELLPGSVVVAETTETIADVILPYLTHPKPRSEFIAWLNLTASTAPLASAVELAPLLSGLIERGLRLAVATNDGQAPAQAHLDAAGVSAHFELVLGYDSGHGGKPSPGQLLAIAKAFDLAPADLVMVGDSLHDLMAGRAAGTQTVGVLSGVAHPTELTPFADVVMADIGELPAWLDEVAGLR